MSNKTNRVSETVIRRLPIYHRYLTDVIEKGVERISSSELSNLTGFTASQIRQDLNNFGGFGQQGYGYNTIDLREQIDKILGMDHVYNTVIVGAGRLGSAIANYNEFKENGFKIQALFDSNPEIVGTEIDSIPVISVDKMEEYIQNKNIDVAIITVPREYAVDVINRLIECGIKGIWNFAPIDISVPDNVVIENIRLNDSLLKLSYYLKENFL
ncbi:redox-sensing transcriptional repressor [Anaerosphaera aminiphila DSM 21120]|uniref:Redox-sensing transcriptional repressor Rex n=1 Tax=Anaerosphaera aminiphila DSM 21120 TaxID=1120995 RepID=A0A1M5QBP4_9FIRM|nr:redox-sensing transcriptional repressor Rex [Anaerosphaera aminiphila]SHH11179.1 redox-sensing transcriptional repressor [Anaerosphaera aminiphila DSM 21120]